MIRIYVKRDKENNIVEYNVTGHSGYGRHGSDIVCSAVSALTQANIIGLIKVLGISGVEHSTRDGMLRCIMPPLDGRGRHEANILLDTMFCALKNIEENYPGNILIYEEEVQ